MFDPYISRSLRIEGCRPARAIAPDLRPKSLAAFDDRSHSRSPSAWCSTWCKFGANGMGNGDKRWRLMPIFGKKKATQLIELRGFMGLSGV
ncbi:hypothetical protein THICB1_170001 [Thiomonas arsenitoxydans]|uniref:Uncharacterized protein n=1 Tax=Thiomonas arsenitoxydans (strain DSM 22701 / CIP 110005 / 3As) TaxID=426114 RepID=A0ABM9T3U4_THIA3|nr:hypothetical protein THICB2_740006 [Thiomonas sp. CB2]CQR31180.1 hypothetical protein THICB1_170001 [Thiomonas arsenitoxydans]VDY06901.1 protein of unknown function [Thiomonas sp. Bio17B3]VDY09803.1 protein of unknown function [Thiomonas sp. Sup16B3]CQR35867.1 hypothetical protein THICB6_240001 [Thiomonas arsenitoxydans]